jgi:hypothetical protein
MWGTSAVSMAMAMANAVDRAALPERAEPMWERLLSPWHKQP